MAYRRYLILPTDFHVAILHAKPRHKPSIVHKLNARAVLWRKAAAHAAMMFDHPAAIADTNAEAIRHRG
jgi:hypothetical protein